MTRWNSKLVNQCQVETQLNFITQENKLTEFQHDFGHIKKTNHLRAVAVPHSMKQLSQLLQFSHRHSLPLTLRSLGYSQSGQSLSVEGGVAVDLSQFNQAVNLENQKITVGASVLWRDLCQRSLTQGSIPYVVPYNTHLNVGGLFSSGGLGAATFKYGVAANYIEKMSIMLSNGELISCHKGDSLHQAVLSGMGQFGVICDATIPLRDCKQQVMSYYLIYDNYQDWVADQYSLAKEVDYLEAYTLSSVLGLRNTPSGRRPLIDWQYCIHCAFEYEQTASNRDALNHLKYRRIAHSESNLMYDFVIRHDNRFMAMRRSGQWQQKHPWFECYVPKDELLKQLPLILEKLPLALGGMYHIFPVALHHPKYFMLPTSNAIMAFNILSPGINDFEVDDCLESLAWLHELLMSIGGKRYVSGWLGTETEDGFWQQHYGTLYQERKALKMEYDPRHIFRSKLLPE